MGFGPSRQPDPPGTGELLSVKDRPALEQPCASLFSGSDSKLHLDMDFHQLPRQLEEVADTEILLNGTHRNTRRNSTNRTGRRKTATVLRRCFDLGLSLRFALAGVGLDSGHSVPPEERHIAGGFRSLGAWRSGDIQNQTPSDAPPAIMGPTQPLDGPAALPCDDRQSDPRHLEAQ